MTTKIRIWATTAITAGTLTGVTWLLAREAQRQWHRVAGPSPTRLDEAVTLLATALALVLCLWLATSTVVALLAHLPGRLGAHAGDLAQVLAPALTRRVAAIVVGAAIGGAIAPGAALGHGPTPADAGGRHAPTSSATGTRLAPGFVPTTGTSPPPGHAGGPGWIPTRPVVRPQVTPDLLTASPSSSEVAGVVVHRGDTLWDLVRDQLGPGASDAEVAEAWPRWYAANRATIGPDPALILPGQVLHAPAPESMEVTR